MQVGPRWALSCLTLAACVGATGPGVGGDTDAITDPAITGSACASAPSYTEDVATCTGAASDYRPRDNNSRNDTWAGCISDDNIYHQIAGSISSIARVEAYETIGRTLWAPGATPTHQDFTSMRVLFEEDQGLGSRIARRYDPHFTAPAAGKCDDAGIAAAAADYCVGPATLQPLLVAAFAEGSLGTERLLNAARIHAALQWFLYVSAIKEATTCTDSPNNCDSSWAYYTGATARDAPKGVAAEIDALGPETHDRAYDGALAVRCWKSLDHESGTSTDLALRDQAITQLDTALLRGMALLVRQRFAALTCTSGDYQAATLEGLRVLVPLLDRATRERDVGAANLMTAEVQKDAVLIDVAAVLAKLDTVYACP